MFNIPRKVGLVIHYSETNYGNHLVNYATKRLLEKAGCDVDVLVFTGMERSVQLSALRRAPHKMVRLVRDNQLGPRVKDRLSRLGENFGEHRAEHAGNHPGKHAGEHIAPLSEIALDRQGRRVAKFRQFSDQYLQPRFITIAERALLRPEYDLFVIGSDQIWNYDYDLGPWHFLDFADKATRMCIAPSIGHASIPSEWRREYARGLGGFPILGMREPHWAQDLRPLVPGTPVTSLVDPTLMLDAQDWAAITSTGKTPRAPETPQAPDASPYLLVYELGAFTPTEWQYINNVATRHGLTVRHLCATADNDLWATDAADFLRLIANSAMVISDSFHGAVFAFLHRKPLGIVRRHGHAAAMNTRVESLAATFGLTGRFIDALPAENALLEMPDGVLALGEQRRHYQDYFAKHDLDLA